MRVLGICLLAIGLACSGSGLLAGGHVAYPGRVEALSRVDISARVDSVVSEIHFQPGQKVGQGDLLFTLDNTDFDQRLRAAESLVQKAQALHEEAQQELLRNQELRQRGTITDVRLFRSQAAEAIASAAVSEAQSKLEIAQVELARTRIHAPIAGIISRPTVSTGSFVEAGRRGVLATIVQLDPIRIVYDIPFPDRLVELGITNLNTITAYSDTVDLRVRLAPDWTHPELADPTFLSADVDPEKGSISAWAIVANPTHVLRPGLMVQVHPLLSESAEAASGSSD